MSERTCSVPDCDNQPKGRGFCKVHHKKIVGRVGPVLQCSIDGCTKLAGDTRGWCVMHYRRWQKRGVHELPLPQTEQSRFFSSVQISDCWEWTSGRLARGYGKFRSDGGRAVLAHRWAYEHLVGPIPAGLVLDHLCMNTCCVNPDHLEAVTQAVNVQRAAQLRRKGSTTR